MTITKKMPLLKQKSKKEKEKNLGDNKKAYEILNSVTLKARA